MAQIIPLMDRSSERTNDSEAWLRGHIERISAELDST
jgi:hypothetical protein